MGERRPCVDCLRPHVSAAINDSRRPESAAEKKLKGALERAQQSEKQKLLAKEKKLALNLLTKVNGHLSSLQVIVSKDDFGNVPPMIRKPLLDAEAKRVRVAKEAEEACDAGGCVMDIKDATNMMTTDRKSIALATDMLTTMAKASS